MLDKISAYKSWAPPGVVWTQWAKPVLFMRPPDTDWIALAELRITYVERAQHNTMLIVDLPEMAGVEEGLALARMGYRPVPLYNGVRSPKPNAAVVRVERLVKALYHGAELLGGLGLSPTAPPVFLLDSNRMQGTGRRPGQFDNRWCVLPQDMPSAAFLRKQGIERVILRANTVENDLSHILKRYQEQGIKIYQSRGGETPKETTITKPPLYRTIGYRLKALMGLTRNSAGGFGGKIPDPSTSTGTRYG
ncbi:hypothetical protein [Paenibacillus daejeonensis]|uniref:hypothetical protein n=1 Tax=Paenibacillus daejeonensis TaxID=135193 RepID=UPI00037A9101|nr:hypothetical protein [Paenibacillus daejeonensis]